MRTTNHESRRTSCFSASTLFDLGTHARCPCSQRAFCLSLFGFELGNKSGQNYPRLNGRFPEKPEPPSQRCHTNESRFNGLFYTRVGAKNDAVTTIEMMLKPCGDLARTLTIESTRVAHRTDAAHIMRLICFAHKYSAHDDHAVG